jgi:hypothetical protein
MEKRRAQYSQRSARGRNAIPETRRARRGASDHAGRWSLPRTRASSTAPATSAACAQTASAKRCIVENVEKIVIAQSPTLDTITSDGNVGAPPAAVEDRQPTINSAG